MRTNICPVCGGYLMRRCDGYRVYYICVDCRSVFTETDVRRFRGGAL